MGYSAFHAEEFIFRTDGFKPGLEIPAHGEVAKRSPWLWRPYGLTAWTPRGKHGLRRSGGTAVATAIRLAGNRPVARARAEHRPHGRKNARGANGFLRATSGASTLSGPRHDSRSHVDAISGVTRLSSYEGLARGRLHRT